MNVAELHKPLRNHLRKVSIVESLWVIHAYVQHLQYQRAMPSQIEVPLWFLSAKGVLEKRVYGWSLDVLARELLINSPDDSTRLATRTLRQWAYFARAINKLKEFEDTLSGTYPKGTGLLEVHRIAHRQFQWQRPPNARWISRYYKVFGHPVIDRVLQRKLGLSTKELYVMALVCMGHYSDNLVLRYPPKIDVPGLDLAMFDRLSAHIALDLATIRVRAREVQEMNANYAYVSNPLRVYPMVWMTVDGHDSLVVPIPTFLTRRLTEGIYYEIRDEPEFPEAFGESFQNYVGEVIVRANVRCALSVYPEREYYVGRLRKDTADWVVEDGEGVLFVECKTKRLRLEAKSTILTEALLEAELDKLAGFISQVYRTISDYKAGLYPEHAYQEEKPIYPVVVTLEEWHVFGPKIYASLEERVRRKLVEDGLPSDWTAEMPYSVCAVNEFERLIQIAESRGIAVFMGRKAGNPTFREWHMHGFMVQEFGEDFKKTRDLFPEVLDQLVPTG
jgi:hypothetical protein